MEKHAKNENPLVIVISGPSGVGKDAVIARLKGDGARFHYVVTATTRSRRTHEVDGIDYYFLSPVEFTEKIEKDEFLEYAEVYGNYYGVLKKEVRRSLDKGEDVIFKVDVQGASTLKQKIPDAVFIFLLPPSITDLTERLKKRNADSEKAVHIRITKAEEELKCMPMFDYVVINSKDDLDKTADTVKAIVIAERCKVKPRSIKI